MRLLATLVPARVAHAPVFFAQAFAPVLIALFPYSAAGCHPSRIDSRPSILAPSICTSCYGGRISMVLRRLRVPPMMVPMSTRRAPRCVPMSRNTARKASPLLKLSIAEVERQQEHGRLRRMTRPERVRRCEPTSPCGVTATASTKKCECLVRCVLYCCSFARSHVTMHVPRVFEP